MKRCSKCGETKPLDEFYKRSSSKDNKAPRCRECSKKAHRGWYATNAEKARRDSRRWIKDNPERAKETKRIYYANNREKVLTAQSKMWAANHRNLRAKFGPSCFDCGQTFPTGMFEYHHLDPSTKKGNTNLRSWKWECLEAYVQGCVQICPNCHRLRHRQEWEIGWRALEVSG